jgi:hypothetical protein
MNWYIRIHLLQLKFCYVDFFSFQMSIFFFFFIFFFESFQMSIGQDDFCSKQVVGVVAVLEVM